MSLEEAKARFEEWRWNRKGRIASVCVPIAESIVGKIRRSSNYSHIVNAGGDFAGEMSQQNISTAGNSPNKERLYDAFISYSHLGERDLARSLEKTLWTFGRAWYKVRGIRTYRDENNLAAQPDLWPEIEAAVQQSGCLVLLASPESARSEWVPREVSACVGERGVKGVCVVQTGGVIPWTDGVKADEFAAHPDAALSPSVWELFAAAGVEPVVIDVRPFLSMPEQKRLRDAEYLSSVAAIAARILGRDKEAIWGQYYRAQRLRSMFLFCVSLVLLGLTVALGFMIRAEQLATAREVHQKNIADQKTRDATDLADRLTSRLTRLRVSNSARLVAAGDTAGALVWATNALINDTGDARIHRFRVTSLLRDYPELVQIIPHEREIKAVEISGDGRWLATVAADTVRMFDAQTGELRFPPFRNAVNVTAITLSPDGRYLSSLAPKPLDDAYLASVSRRIGIPKINRNSLKIGLALSSAEPVEVRTWDLQTGREVSPWVGEVGRPELIRYSADSRHLMITGSKAFVIRVSGKDNSEPVVIIRKSSDYAVFSPDGLRILVSNCGEWVHYTVDGHELSQGKQTGGCTSEGSTPAFSADGRLFATSSKSSVQMWNAETGKPVLDPLKHAGAFMEFSPDNGLLAIVDGDVQVEDVHLGVFLGVLSSFRHPNPVVRASFSPDGRYLLTVDRQEDIQYGNARVWDTKTGASVIPWLHDIGEARWFPDGHRLLATGRDHTARVFELFTANPIIPLQEQRLVRGGRVSQDNTKLEVCQDDDVKIVDIASLRPLSPPLDIPCGLEDALRPLISPDNGRLLSDVESVIDLLSGKRLFKLPELAEDALGREFSYDGQRLLIAVGSHEDDTGSLYIWDARTPHRVTGPLSNHGLVIAFHFNRDASLAVSTSSDGSARVWAASSGKLLHTLPHNNPVRDKDLVWQLSGRDVVQTFAHPVPVFDAEFDPGGDILVTAGDDGTTRFWDVKTGKEVPPAIKNEGVVRQASFSPDGLSLLIRSEARDRKTVVMRVWDEKSRQPRTPPMDCGDQTFFESKAAYSPDGRLIIAPFAHGFQVWDATTGEPVTTPFDQAGIEIQDLNKGMVCLRGTLLRSTLPGGLSVPIGWDSKPSSTDFKVWRLPTDDRSPTCLINLAQVLASRRIDPTENLVQLTQEELATSIEALQKEHAIGHSLAGSHEAEWHAFESEECELTGHWHCAEWHLSKLLESDGRDPQVLAGRGNARAMMGLWKPAAEDYDHAVEYGAHDPETFLAVARLRLLNKDLVGYRRACDVLLQRYSASREPKLLGALVRVLALAPQDSVIAAQMVAIAERAVAVSKEGDYTESLAAARYRAGQTKEAVERLRKAESSFSRALVAVAEAQLADAAHAHPPEDKFDRIVVDVSQKLRVLQDSQSVRNNWRDLAEVLILKDQYDKLF